MLNTKRRTTNRAVNREHVARTTDIRPAKIKDPNRRKRCLRSPFTFMRTYFPEVYSSEFNSIQREIVNSLIRVIRYGGSYAIAAPRGGGKTMLTEGCVIYAILSGLVKYVVILGATTRAAEEMLERIKFKIATSDPLFEDFPDVVAACRDVQAASQRSRGQTVRGQFTHIRWSSDRVDFPVIKNSKSSGTILAARGLDGAIRGLVGRDGRRPDVIIIDDPETRDSAESPLQCKKRTKIIEQDLGGLAGPGQALSSVMLCTLMNRYCVAADYTDQKKRPAWSGRRFAMMPVFPDRRDLWEQYMDRRKKEQQAGDPYARGAHQFYLDNREWMDYGAEVTDPDRFNAYELADGSPCEVSAIQHCFNLITDRGEDDFLIEYNNDPPDETVDDSLTIDIICRQLSGLSRRVLPEDTRLVGAIDVGMRELWWTLVGFTDRARGFICDYGRDDIFLKGKDDESIEIAISTALWKWKEGIEEDPIIRPDGEVVELELAVVDSGFRNAPIYSFCKEAGATYKPTKGQDPLSVPRTRTRTCRPGHHWKEVWQQPERTWLLEMGSNYWKRKTHDGFRANADRPGSLSLFEDPEESHKVFARQIIAEYEDPDTHKFVKRYRDNHFLDCVYASLVAANQIGIATFRATDRRRKTRTKSLKQLAGAK